MIKNKFRLLIIFSICFICIILTSIWIIDNVNILKSDISNSDNNTKPVEYPPMNINTSNNSPYHGTYIRLRDSWDTNTIGPNATIITAKLNMYGGYLEVNYT